MGKKGLVGQLGLVLGPDSVPDFMEPHCVLEDHDLQHLCGLIVGEHALVDESSYPGFLCC